MAREFNMATTMAKRLLFAAVITCILTVIKGQQFVTVQPNQIVAKPGSNASFICKVGYPIAFCRVTIPGHEAYSLYPNNGANGVTYFGQGLDKGECGATITNIQDANNGEVSCNIPPDSGAVERSGKMKLVVAKKPDQPFFEPLLPSSLGIGTKINIRCVIPNGRPVANISWTLGDQPLLQDLHMTSITDGTTVESKTITQNLSRVITERDNGLTLKCIANHIMFEDEPLFASVQIRVEFAPLQKEDPITIFGIKIGQTGTINVTVQANPKPEFQWFIDDKYVLDNSQDEFGRLLRMESHEIGNSIYNATLIIPDITREDTERSIVLKVRNKLGSSDYQIQMTTSDVPEGADLGVGEIVGIVIAVLVVLIIIFLVIFAKATDRWCFGDGTMASKSRAAGESSDTESTDATTRAKSKENPDPKESTPMTRAISFQKPFNFKSLLPGGVKNKDKVAQIEAATDRLESKVEEEAKPLQSKSPPQDQTELVYAELALNKPTQDQENRPQQEKTEYAEIVYNSQPIENKMETKQSETK